MEALPAPDICAARHRLCAARARPVRRHDGPRWKISPLGRLARKTDGSNGVVWSEETILEHSSRA